MNIVLLYYCIVPRKIFSQKKFNDDAFCNTFLYWFTHCNSSYRRLLTATTTIRPDVNGISMLMHNIIIAKISSFFFFVVVLND